MANGTLGLTAGVVLLVGSLASGQEKPVFRTEVYSVPLDFSVETRLPFGIRKPIKDLTMQEVTIVLDKTTYPPVQLSQDPKRPGHYVVSFTPPDGYRDGERHSVDVTVMRKRWRSPITMPMTIAFPKLVANSSLEDPVQRP